MQAQHTTAQGIGEAVELGFDPVQAGRLAFVRWSMLEGYAQFSEFISSDDPTIETRPGFEPTDWRTDVQDTGREVETA